MSLPSYLMDHQRKDVAHGLRVKRHLYANDTGTGKTVIGIELHRAINKKTLVVCPISIMETAWMADIARFSPEVKAVNLWTVMNKGSKPNKKRQALIDAINDHDVCLINFESFAKLWAKKDPGSGGYQLHDEVSFDVLMIDESSRCKNNQAKVTKALISFADKVEYAFLFSGTPAPNSNLEYWSQVRMVHRDAFGPSFYRFRNRFFYPSGYGGYTWLPREDRSTEFKDILSRHSSAVKKHDVLDLPERSEMTREVTLGAAEQKIYKSMLNQFYVMINDQEITAANAAVKMSKLRQICSGFLIGEDGVQKVGTSKMDELKLLLEDIGKDRPVIIWTQFQYEAASIVKMLEDAGETVGRVDGTVPQKQKDEHIKSFKDGRTRYLVAHPRSLGHGATLINCTDMVYFSMSYSLEEYLQSRDRIYRYGQRNACSYYFLVAAGTIESAVIRAVTRKHDIANEVIDYIKQHGGANVKRSAAATAYPRGVHLPEYVPGGGVGQPC